MQTVHYAHLSNVRKELFQDPNTNVADHPEQGHVAIISEESELYDKYTETDETETLPLDEENELYGYGVFNVHKEKFVSKLGEHYNPDTVKSEEEALKHFKDIVADQDGDGSHLRLVEVRLSNELDKKASEENY